MSYTDTTRSMGPMIQSESLVIQTAQHLLWIQWLSTVR